MDYKQKYIKYKQKYLENKINQSGKGLEKDNKIIYDRTMHEIYTECKTEQELSDKLKLLLKLSWEEADKIFIAKKKEWTNPQQSEKKPQLEEYTKQMEKNKELDLKTSMILINTLYHSYVDTCYKQHQIELLASLTKILISYAGKEGVTGSDIETFKNGYETYFKENYDNIVRKIKSKDTELLNKINYSQSNISSFVILINRDILDIVINEVTNITTRLCEKDNFLSMLIKNENVVLWLPTEINFEQLPQYKELITEVENYININTQEYDFKDIEEDELLFRSLYEHKHNIISIYKYNNLCEIYQSFEKNYYKQLQKIISQYEQINRVPISELVTIKYYNIKLFQLTLFFTLVVMLTNKFADTTMNRYIQNEPKIQKFFNEVIARGIDKIEEIKPEFFPPTIYNAIFKDYTYEDINKNDVILLSYAGILTIDELIVSNIHKIYYVGVCEEMSYADGRLYTPLEFLNHDLIHYINSNECIDNVRSNVDRFYKYISGKRERDELNLILFLILHEADFPTCSYMKNQNLTEDVQRRITDTILKSAVIGIKRFLNKHDLGELLPHNLVKANSKELVREYIVRLTTQYYKTWNECFSIKQYDNNSNKSNIIKF